MERTMRLMGAMAVLVAAAACNNGSVTGPSIVGPGPGGTPGPDPVNNVDVQGSGDVVTETREVFGFARVTLRGVGHLVIVERAYGPDHVEVARCLEHLAHLETREGRFGEARSSYERATAIRRKVFAADLPVRDRNLYNLACVESLAGDKEKALERLRQAVDAGWARPVIFDDPDMNPLRGDPRFEAIATEVKGRLADRG